MSRMKTFFIYLLLFIALFIFVSVMSYLFVKTSYHDLYSYEIATESPKVTIKESKATSANGYIIGTVKNDTGSTIEKINLKVDFYSKRGIDLGTKYVKIENFEPNETKEFRINYQLNNVQNYVVEMTYNDVIEAESGDIFTTNEKIIWLLGGILVWSLIPPLF